ncbi:hypothetical protein E4U35_005424 [Claviceps purpurea]|nr:hypothetical protein E4U35_005424 [Claviceps purpurea]
MEGHVLVKNTKGALLLRFPRSISVFGYSARSARGPAPAADVLAPSADDEVSLDMWRYGQTSICVGQAVEGLLGNAQPAATKGTLMGGGGSGGSTPAVFVSSHDALSRNSSRAVKLLYGEASPSGKLPYTLARNASDYGHLMNPDKPARRFQNFSQSDFTEGVYLDYKYFYKYNVTPEIQTQSQSTGGSGSGSGSGNTGEWPTRPIVPGGQADLFDTIAQGSVRVRNTGKMAGAEVQQLYVGIPTGPAKQLRGFEKPLLRPGQAQMVEFILTRRDLRSGGCRGVGRRISHRKGNERLTVVDDDGLARATDPTC